MRRSPQRERPVRLRAVVLLALLAMAPVLRAAPPPQAFVRTAEEGQALLLKRLGECYAVTPAHVLGDELFASLTGGHSRRPQGDGDLLQTFGYDLAILHVTGALAGFCNGSPVVAAGLEDRLATADRGVLTSVNADGSISRRRVTLSDVGLLYLRVRPERDRDQLFKGLSGSLLLVGDRPAGILMAVDADTGEGRVLRYDRALETLRPFFGGAGRAARRAASPPKLAIPRTGPAPEVVSWNVPPLDADHRAANLVDGKQTVWYASAGSFPVEVVLELPGDKTSVVQEVRLIGRGVAPAARLPRDFEILVSSRPDGHWLPVATGSYIRTEQEKTVGFVPVRVRRLMLRIYSNWGDPTAVGLAGIEVPVAR